MRCSKCGADNRETAKFCDSCGAVLVRSPLATAASNTKPARTVAVGERRHLTVLFCDLVNSTRLATQLDPEEWREVVRSYHRVAAEAITRFGGHVAQYLGDGVMAYFGWPAAHENAPERAARAGLEIVDQIAELSEQITHAKLSARVGIDSGAVVVGGGAGKDAGVFGEVPNIAARVQALAEPDTVVVTGATQRLIRGLFTVEELGAQSIKGIERRVQLYRLIGPSGVRSRLDLLAASRGLTPFVGREHELRLLMERWRPVRNGEGQVISIIGEAGVGKSRLVRRFRERVAETHTWVEAAAGPFFQNTPLYPVAEILNQLPACGNEPGQGEEQQGKFAPQPAFAPAQVEFTSQLSWLRSVGSLDLLKQAEQPLSPHQRRELLFKVVERVLGSAQSAPLVIAIEDLHWADASTLELIQLLVEQGKNASLLILCTARPEFRASWPQSQITLSPLSAYDTRIMVEHVAGQRTLAEETLTTVVERTGGVPLFIEELTRAVLESGTEHAGRSVPATLHDSLMARLDRLGTARDTLQLAAVLGPQFTYELLRAVAPLEHDQLQRHLLVLTDAELLYAIGPPHDARYQFKHALIRDAAYGALLKSRRRELHTRIAQIIEEHFSRQADSHPEVLAHHYTEGGLFAQAVDNWRKAGRAANSRSAYTEAIAHLRRGLELLRQLPADRRTQAELELQIQLAVGLVGIKGWHDAEVGAAYQRAYQLWRGNYDDPSYFSILFGLWMNRLVRAEHSEARGYAEQLVRTAPMVSEPELEVQAYWALGCSQFYMGELERAHASFSHVIDLYDVDKHSSVAFRFGQDPCMSSMVLQSHVLWLLGYSEQSTMMATRAISLARNLKHPFTMAWCLAMLAMEDVQKRDFSRADERVSEGILISREYGFGDIEANLQDVRTLRRLMEGAAPEVRADARSASQTRAREGKGLHHPYGYTESAEALGRVKRLDKAIPAVELALKLISQTGERYWEAEAWRIHGELLLAQPGASDGRGLKEAETSIRRAIQIAREQNARMLELRATMSLARLLVTKGRHDEARNELAHIYKWFTEDFHTADLTDAKALLNAL